MIIYKDSDKIIVYEKAEVDMRQYTVLENRTDYRVHTDIIAEYISVDQIQKTSRKHTVIIKNLSSDGLYFETDEELDLRAELEIVFQLPTMSAPIRAGIKVCRIEILEGDKPFGLGAVFLEISSQDKKAIQDLVERLNINGILKEIIKQQGSDLHLLAEQAPIMRIQGELVKLTFPKLSPEEISQMLYSIMTKQQIRTFEKDKELDFGIQYDMHNRFRINVHQQKGFLEATFRLIKEKTFSFEELRIPEAVKDLARQPSGLVLITGPAGSGKTTTTAAMVELINRERTAVIITLERPIEYIHSPIKSIIKQREIGVDTISFSVALKNTLRQDPNIIVIGELDDVETIKTALLAAEAGYLVIATFHAPNTIQALDRLVGVLPSENRKQFLSQLANCLRGVVSQLLLPCKDGTSRVLATEILMANDAVKSNIRKDQLFQLASIIQTGAGYKMHSLTDSIVKYLKEGMLSEETARFFSEEFTVYSRG